MLNILDVDSRYTGSLQS